MHIIIDTREKKDILLFNSYEEITTEFKKLDTGDYSIKGFETKITIDRKRNSAELQMCLFSQYKRFRKELERMGSYDESYILCTFPLKHLYIFPNESGMPKRLMKKFKGGASYLRKKFYEVCEEFPYVKFVFSDDQMDAENRAYNILRRYYDANN